MKDKEQPTTNESTHAGCRIRPAAREDLGPLTDLWLDLMREHEGNPVLGRVAEDAKERRFNDFRDEIKDPDTLVVVAESEGRIVAFLKCDIAEAPPILAPRRYGFVQDAYVAPELRKRGLLSVFMERAYEFCRERKVKEICVATASDNPHANAAFTKMGFGPVQVIRYRELPSK